jgi:hypothetical protein
MFNHFRNGPAPGPPARIRRLDSKLAALGELGAVSVPLALVMVVAFVAWVGLWQAMRDWRKVRDQQMALDECVSQQAKKSAQQLNRLKRIDQGIQAARAALVLAIEPSARATLMATLQTLGAWAQAEDVAWKAQAASWILRRGCGKAARAIPLPFPEAPWTLDPPDALGARPLRWSETHALEIQNRAGTRFSRAWIVRRDHQWHAQWRRHTGPSSP